MVKHRKMMRPNSAGSNSSEEYRRVVRGGNRDRRNSRRDLDIADESHENYDNKRMWRTFLDTVDTKTLDEVARFQILSFAIKHPLPQRHRLRLWRHHVFRETPVDAPELKALISGELKPEQTSAVDCIMMDIPRTPWVSEADEEEGLTHVLIGFSIRHKEIGYTQGLNLVGMIPLVVGFNEFETLALLEKIVCQGGLLEGCPGKEDLSVFQLKAATSLVVIQRRFPSLAARLREARVDLTLVSFDAFLSLFASRMPLHAVLRFWDFCILAHEPEVIPDHLPTAPVLALLIAQLQCILVQLPPDEDDDHLLVGFHRVLAELSVEKTEDCLAQAMRFLPIVKSALNELKFSFTPLPAIQSLSPSESFQSEEELSIDWELSSNSDF